MKRKIHPDILFLSGVILVCFGLLLLHLYPIWEFSTSDSSAGVILFFYQVLSRPTGPFSLLLGLFFIFKGLKK